MPLAPRTVLGGLIRLVHPFPILLDAIATGAIAVVAGADGPTALRLGFAMLALQASIGTLNDLVDAPADAGRKPGKPIPAGLVVPDVARVIAVGSAGIGLALAAPSGVGLLLLAGLGLAIGYGYDLAAKGTPWSWLPFAIGLPLLPVFAWYGATGDLPSRFTILLPAAVLAGPALAIANARADVARDESAAVGSVAIWLGPRRARVIGALLQAAVALIAVGSLLSAGAEPPSIAAAVLSAGVTLTGVGMGRSSSPVPLEWAWEIQAIGTVLLGVSWLWGMPG